MKTITIEGVEISLTPEQIKKIEDAKKPSPEQYLIDILNQVTGKLFQGRQVWYLEDQWIFEVDYERKTLWCYYYKVYHVLEVDYKMTYEEIQQLTKDVVCKALNLEGFAPNLIHAYREPQCTRL